ncbi:hypothetical protein GQ600_5886 [Phytophthora cactorum]|nr:hypothetical protein GQ600_5886 [Phytophthora cactorum]
MFPISFRVVVVVPTKSGPGNYRYGSGFYGAFVFRVICLNGLCVFIFWHLIFLLYGAHDASFIFALSSQQQLWWPEISPERLLQAVQYYKYLTESQAHGVQPTPPPDAIKEIFDL